MCTPPPPGVSGEGGSTVSVLFVSPPKCRSKFYTEGALATKTQDFISNFTCSVMAAFIIDLLALVISALEGYFTLLAKASESRSQAGHWPRNLHCAPELCVIRVCTETHSTFNRRCYASLGSLVDKT